MTPAAFRRLALALPETTESKHVGHPDFRVRNKIFATLAYPDAAWGMVKLTPAQQRGFVRAHPEVFRPVKGGWGRKGATSVRLRAATAVILQPALEAAWKNAARPSLAATTGQKSAREHLPLRITVLDPPPNIRWALQSGREENVPPTAATRARVSFDFDVELVRDSSPAGFRLKGPVVQGRAGDRFVYLRIGAYAGQAAAAAGWRAKIGLEGITGKLVAQIQKKPAGRLEARFEGTSPRGGPSCATVELLGGWQVA
jgi:hypothetical protein